MKKLLLLFLVCSLPLCAQEPPTKFKKGKAYVMPMEMGFISPQLLESLDLPLQIKNEEL